MFTIHSGAEPPTNLCVLTVTFGFEVAGKLMDRSFALSPDRQGPGQRSLFPGSVTGTVISVGQNEFHSPISLVNVKLMHS